MKSIHFFAALFFLFITISADAQGSTITLDNIKPSFTESSKKSLDKAEKFLKKSRGYFADADLVDEKKLKASGSKKEKLEKTSMKIKVKGSEQLGKANIIIHKVLKNELKKNYLAASNEILKKEVENIEKEATSDFSKAIKRRNKAKQQTKIASVYKYTAEADELELQAIDAQIKAIAILKGLGNVSNDDPQEQPVEETTEEVTYEEETTYEEPENNTTNFEAAENVNEKREETTEIFPVNNPDTKTTTENNNSFSNDQEKQENVIFKIQIAASKVPLSVEKLRQIYKSDEIINNEKEGIWYKYNVGYFKSYREAYEYKKRMNVKGAFIVAYRDGTVKVKNINEVAEPIEE